MPKGFAGNTQDMGHDDGAVARCVGTEEICPLSKRQLTEPQQSLQDSTGRPLLQSPVRLPRLVLLEQQIAN